MRHVHVPCHDDRFFLFQLFQIRAEIVLPFHPVIKARQFILGVGRIYGDKVIIPELAGDHAAFLIVFFDPDAVRHA